MENENTKKILDSIFIEPENNICKSLQTNGSPDSPCDFYIKGGTCKKRKNFLCVEKTLREDRYLSASQIKAWGCRYKWYLSYVKKLDKATKQRRMYAGLMMHEFLAWVHSSYRREGDEWRWSIEQLRPMSATERIFLMSMTMNYPFKNISGDTEVGWTNSDTKVRGYVDLFIERADGNTVWEHKYTTKPDNFNKFTLESQLVTYFCSTLDPDKAIINLVKVPSLRQGKHESIETFKGRVEADIPKRLTYYYQQKTFYRSEYDLDKTIKKYRHIRDEIRTALEMYSNNVDTFWQNESMCFAGGFPCDYLPICENNCLVPEGMYKQKSFDRGGKE